MESMPDSRVVEEIHRLLRECVSVGSTKQQRNRHTKMRVAVAPKVFITRKMNAVSVNKTDFVANWRRKSSELVTRHRHDTTSLQILHQREGYPCSSCSGSCSSCSHSAPSGGLQVMVSLTGQHPRSSQSSFLS